MEHKTFIEVEESTPPKSEMIWILSNHLIFSSHQKIVQASIATGFQSLECLEGVVLLPPFNAEIGKLSGRVFRTSSVSPADIPIRDSIPLIEVNDAIKMLEARVLKVDHQSVHLHKPDQTSRQADSIGDMKRHKTFRANFDDLDLDDYNIMADEGQRDVHESIQEVDRE